MTISTTLVSILIFVYSIQTQNYQNLYAINIGISIGYVYKYAITNNFNLQQLARFLLQGETLYAILYIVWLALFQKSSYLYFVPIFFSTSSKLYWLIVSKDRINEQFLEESTLFQTKAEIFVLGYQILSIYYGGINILFSVGILFAILKLKYGFYEKSQSAFKQLYFAIDNSLKRTKLRSKYQKIAHLLRHLGSVYGGSKQILY